MVPPIQTEEKREQDKSQRTRVRVVQIHEEKMNWEHGQCQNVQGPGERRCILVQSLVDCKSEVSAQGSENSVVDEPVASKPKSVKGIPSGIQWQMPATHLRLAVEHKPSRSSVENSLPIALATHEGTAAARYRPGKVVILGSQ